MTPTSPAHGAPFQRTRHNLLITGHRPSRLPKQPQQLARLEQAIDQTVRQIAAHAAESGAALRILTGVADGADASAARIAADQSLALDLVAGCPPAALTPDLARAEHSCYIEAHYLQDLQQATVAAADDAKLALADAMLLVWDGRPAQGQAGGSVRLMIAALRQFTPVIWIDASEDGAAAVRLVDHRKLDAAAFAALTFDPDNAAALHALFAAPGQLTLAQALAPFWDGATLAALSAPLVDARVTPADGGAYRGPATFVEAAGWRDDAWTWFDRCDIAATRAALRHRRQIKVVELSASLAVLGAVAGAIGLFEIDVVWGIFELLTLLCIGGVVLFNQFDRHNNHSVWMTFRPAAEALRISAMLHGLMASLDSFRSSNWRNDRDGKAVLSKPHHWLVTQLMREAGVPARARHCLEERQDDNKLALTALLQDQIGFHRSTAHKTEHLHHRLHLATSAVYGIVLLTVLLHLYALADSHSALGHWIHQQRWPLLITAFFPALAAALHGISTKLQLAQVAHSSETALHALQDLLPAIDVCAKPMALRAVALEAAGVMYAEHNGWNGLMEHQTVTIP